MILSLKLNPILKFHNNQKCFKLIKFHHCNIKSSSIIRMSSVYSVWMTPSDDKDTFQKLKNTISHFSSTYDTPTFEPHVTLIGGISGLTQDQAIDTCKNLSNSIKVINFTLNLNFNF